MVQTLLITTSSLTWTPIRYHLLRLITSTDIRKNQDISTTAVKNTIPTNTKTVEALRRLVTLPREEIHTLILSSAYKGLLLALRHQVCLTRYIKLIKRGLWVGPSAINLITTRLTTSSCSLRAVSLASSLSVKPCLPFCKSLDDNYLLGPRSDRVSFQLLR